MKHKAGATYEIWVRGHLDSCWSDWFEGMAITYPSVEETLLCGRVTDQSALQGLLAKIWDLGLSVLAMQQLNSKETNEE